MLTLSEFQIKLPSHFVTPAFSLQLPLPQHYIVAGRNSSGKSVLLNAIAGNGTPLSGQRTCEAVIADVSISAQQALIEEERKKDSADLLDVIATPTRVDELLANVNPNYATHPLFNDLATALRIEHLFDNTFLSLSTGETRKIIIMMAWLSNANLILLDEPFEGLDRRAIDTFRQFMVNQNQASLIITANKLADLPKGISAELLVIENMTIAWRSERTLNYHDIHSELSTWFALGEQDVTLPEMVTTNKSGSAEASVANSNDSLPDVLIALNHGEVKYDERIIFENLNFTLNKNEHWQITGPNGSGKTCLLQMFTGDNPHCYTNDLTMFGIKRGSGESIWDIKKHIGIMSNALHMQHKVNVSAEHVVISGFYDSIGLYARPSLEERQIAQQWLARLGLKRKKDTPFKSLSFGDQRLILIARSMVKHPAILVLDEPCNGLDDFNRQKTLKLIQLLANAGTTTLLYVTHSAEDNVPAIKNILDMRYYNPAFGALLD